MERELVSLRSCCNINLIVLGGFCPMLWKLPVPCIRNMCNGNQRIITNKLIDVWAMLWACFYLRGLTSQKGRRLLLMGKLAHEEAMWPASVFLAPFGDQEHTKKLPHFLKSRVSLWHTRLSEEGSFLLQPVWWIPIASSASAGDSWGDRKELWPWKLWVPSSQWGWPEPLPSTSWGKLSSLPKALAVYILKPNIWEIPLEPVSPATCLSSWVVSLSLPYI